MNDTQELMFYPIADRLRALRIKEGITQKAVARYAGVSTVHMNRLEQCKDAPSMETLYSWCVGLGFTPQIVLRKTGDGIRV